MNGIKRSENMNNGSSPFTSVMKRASDFLYNSEVEIANINGLYHCIFD